MYFDITVSHTHIPSSLKCSCLKLLRGDKSSAWFCFPPPPGCSERELLGQSWARKWQTKSKQRDGWASSLQLCPMLWQVLHKLLMWTTGPGQSPGFQSGYEKPLASLCQALWQLETVMREKKKNSRWSSITSGCQYSMSVGISGGKLHFNNLIRREFFWQWLQKLLKYLVYHSSSITS